MVGSFNLKQSASKEIALLAHKNEVYVVDIFDKLEAVCPPKGEYPAEFDGQKAIISNTNEKYELSYEGYFENKRRDLKEFCIQNGAHYRAVRSDVPIYTQLRPI